MEYAKLEANIIDCLKEEQAKLGYRSESVRLYYPLQSLNRFLKADLGTDEMQAELQRFSHYVSDRLGAVEISHSGDRFCFLLPPQAGDYVHRHTDASEFIYDFINTVSRHGVTMEEVLGLFRKYSDHVHIEKAEPEEFDYLVWFEDGKPDSFRYCISDEGCHIIYHRFTEDDYNDIYSAQT